MVRLPRSPLVALVLLGVHAASWAPGAWGLTQLRRISYDPLSRRIVIKADGPLAPLSYLVAADNCWEIELRHTDYSHLTFDLQDLPADPVRGFVFNVSKPATARVIFYLSRPAPFPYRDRAITRHAYSVGLGPLTKAGPSVSVGARFALKPVEKRPLPYPEWAMIGPASSHWDWQTSSQVLFSSNVFQFNDGPSQAGARLSYRGLYRQYLPQVHGVLLGDVEQQSLRFVEPRFDYGNVVTSVALNHTLSPWIQLFEGGAMQYSKADFMPEASFLDSNLFTGAGIFGKAPGGGMWYGSLTVDRVATSLLRDSYYGQALRLGYRRLLFWNLSLQGQGTLQRVDPMVVSTPFFRSYLYGSLETRAKRGWSYGVRALSGAQQLSGTLSWYSEVGPFLQTRF